jgi:hypothetical protein
VGKIENDALPDPYYDQAVALSERLDGQHGVEAGGFVTDQGSGAESNI